MEKKPIIFILGAKIGIKNLTNDIIFNKTESTAFRIYDNRIILYTINILRIALYKLLRIWRAR